MGVGDVKNRRADVHHPPLRCIGVESANVGVAILGDLQRETPKKTTRKAGGRMFGSRKKVVAAASQRERAYKRTGEPSVPFCEEEE